jgi:hypothetical protein
MPFHGRRGLEITALRGSILRQKHVVFAGIGVQVAVTGQKQHGGIGFLRLFEQQQRVDDIGARRLGVATIGEEGAFHVAMQRLRLTPQRFAEQARIGTGIAQVVGWAMGVSIHPRRHDIQDGMLA